MFVTFTELFQNFLLKSVENVCPIVKLFLLVNHMSWKKMSKKRMLCPMSCVSAPHLSFPSVFQSSYEFYYKLNKPRNKFALSRHVEQFILEKRCWRLVWLKKKKKKNAVSYLFMSGHILRCNFLIFFFSLPLLASHRNFWPGQAQFRNMFIWFIYMTIYKNYSVETKYITE